MSHSPQFLAAVEAAKTSIKEINPQDSLAQQAKGALLVDVREDTEWQAGRIAGAIHLGKGVIERDIEKAIADKNSKIILYCGGGFRSALAAESIQKMGYTDVFSMSGGWREWTTAGLPVS